ncbi:coiled-coil domain-containing protein 177 [Lucilia cuprina]|uniref:coiled-coil domain-containing protein 177 n=1 Tax=Lucilia cuprina TaxID=7375 RepID=UPI001F068F74|nr:coiled-coil domain-containing protein 177 [Lucilia cuprina]
MSSKRRYSLSETRIEEHLKLLEKLETLPLADSCCDICHCDCYNSHRSETEECCLKEIKDIKNIQDKLLPVEVLKTNVKKKISASTPPTTKPSVKVKSNKKYSNETQLPNENLTFARKSRDSDIRKKRKGKKRSKSVGLPRSQSQCSERYYTRDCEILQNLLTSLDDKNLTNLEIVGKSTETQKDTMLNTSRTIATLPQTHYSFSYLDDTDNSFAPIRLSESMANLCLAPTIKEAYTKVPDHDKRILNRMATKRTEQALAKENAWLARKYWENERYERELLKCEQMEEYKKAVRDKQFQDYLQTKARLNDIAQRDLEELKRLKESLQQKDDRTKKRLQSLRIERDMAVNQKRCEELRKIECVNLHQEEQNLDELLRKSETCQRLTERLKRADHIRNKMLENYLKRLRYDNYIEQLQHEEHWREVQLNEQLKREQLKKQISRKRCRSQHFVESKQQRNECIRKTAKLSKSLRDIVRSSVTPETGVSLFGTGVGANNVGINSQHTLSKLLLDRPF